MVNPNYTMKNFVLESVAALALVGVFVYGGVRLSQEFDEVLAERGRLIEERGRFIEERGKRLYEDCDSRKRKGENTEECGRYLPDHNITHLNPNSQNLANKLYFLRVNINIPEEEKTEDSL